MRFRDVFSGRRWFGIVTGVDQRERGFTFVELMITVALLAIAAMVALPSLRPDDPLKVIGAATMLASDIEFAQSATLASPADPTIVQFADKQPRYWLALQSDPATPILRPNGKPYEVFFGQDGAQFLAGLQVELQTDPDGAITFDAFGRLTQTEDAHVVVGNPSGALVVTVKSTTGSVSIAE
jgi:prepilin-type N-terminal cleavage/methylation domain-containing protein